MEASYVQSSFSGGEWSRLAQGRYHDQRYRTALNVCLNLIPTEQEAIVRRPGFQFAGTTRDGTAGRVVSFAFEQMQPYTIEFTDSFLRLRSGLSIVTTNDSVTIISVSTANPAVVTLSAAVSWATGDQAYFTAMAGAIPVLENRIFILTKLTTTTFSLADAVTGTNINGAGFGMVAGGARINRVLDIVTPYVGGIWMQVRMVQTEATAFLFHPKVPPQVLIATTQPNAVAGLYATFNFSAAIFNDGPYLDPFMNGVQANPSAVSGIINLTLSFPTYSATTAYAKGAFVTSSAINYQSLQDQNVGNTPAGSPSFWQAVSAGAAINSGQGFLPSDVGRLVRLYSEPAMWLAGTTYAKGNTVSYNPSGLPGQTTYWNSLLASNTGNVPGTDLINWQLLPQGGTSSPANWTWGKITGLLNVISGGTGTNIGNMTSGGGIASAFDGNLSKAAASSAEITASYGAVSGFYIDSVTGYVGKNYSGGGGQKIAQATVYPSNNNSFASGQYVAFAAGVFFSVNYSPFNVTLNLRGKASLPANSADGTLLATSTFANGSLSPVNLTSSDQTTSWNYVWVETIAQGSSFNQSNATITAIITQIVFSNPAGTGTGNGVTVEILGPPLLYTTPVITWRLGSYSNTTGWPTCGTYSDGRLWLSGIYPNRVDACVSNGIIPGSNVVNWAPTDQYGNVLASSGITATFNAPDANPIFWMIPDLQGILAGTKAGEWLIQAPTAGPISPFNINARRVTTIGCANIEPRRTEHTTVFVQKFLRKIMEFFPDVFSGKFTAPHITFWSKHLTIGNVAEIAYQQELNPIVWARLTNGNLVGWTYKRDTLMTSQGPTMAAGHRHSLGSGQQVTSICTGPNVGGTVDALTIVALDPATNVYHVEVLGDTLDEGSTLFQANFVDDAITPTSTSSNNSTPSPYGGLTLNGLWPLNGKTVTAWLAGLDCGDYTVSNGSITVPYGDGVAAGTANGLFTAAYFATNPSALVGFTYTSQGQIVRAHSREESGARSGPALGKKRRHHYFMALLEGTQGVSFGTDFTAEILPAIFRQDGGTTYAINAQFNGVWRDQVKGDYDFDGMLCWQITRPYICNIATLGGALQTQDV